MKAKGEAGEKAIEMKPEEADPCPGESHALSFRF